MKCKFCGSEWQSKIAVKICPFCGKSLVVPNSFEDIESALAYIMNVYGEQVKRNPNHVIAYLGDLAPKLAKERRLMKICADAGIIAELLSITGETEKNYATKRAVSLLNSEYFIETKRAEEAVGWLTKAVFRAGPEGGRISVPRTQLEEELSAQQERIRELRNVLKKQEELRRYAELEKAELEKELSAQKECIRRLLEELGKQKELKKQESAKVFHDTETNVLNDVPTKREDLEKHTHRILRIGRNDPCPCGSGLKWKRCICPQYHPV